MLVSTSKLLVVCSGVPLSCFFVLCSASSVLVMCGVDDFRRRGKVELGTSISLLAVIFKILVIKRVLISGLEVLFASYIDVLKSDGLSLASSLPVLASAFNILCKWGCELVVVFFVSITSVGFLLTPSRDRLGTIFDVIILSVVDRSSSGETLVFASALDEIALKFAVLNSSFCEVPTSGFVEDTFWSDGLRSVLFVDVGSKAGSVLASALSIVEDTCFCLEVETSNFLSVVTKDAMGVLASTLEDFGLPFDVLSSGLFVEDTCEPGVGVGLSYFEETSFASEELTSTFLVETGFGLDEIASPSPVKTSVAVVKPSSTTQVEQSTRKIENSIKPLESTLKVEISTAEENTRAQSPSASPLKTSFAIVKLTSTVIPIHVEPSSVVKARTSKEYFSHASKHHHTSASFIETPEPSSGSDYITANVDFTTYSHMTASALSGFKKSVLSSITSKIKNTNETATSPQFPQITPLNHTLTPSNFTLDHGNGTWRSNSTISLIITMTVSMSEASSAFPPIAPPAATKASCGWTNSPAEPGKYFILQFHLSC